MRRIKFPYSALTLILFLLMGCASLPPYEGTIRRASEVKLYEVEPNATNPLHQSNPAQYVGNYFVKREITLSAEQQREIKDMILNADLYVETQVKSCLHQAKYAIEFRYRDITDLTFVLSMSPCSKAYVTDKGGKEELVDLPVNHPFEDVIDAFGQQ